jgi:hypothetical protein
MFQRQAIVQVACTVHSVCVDVLGIVRIHWRMHYASAAADAAAAWSDALVYPEAYLMKLIWDRFFHVGLCLGRGLQTCLPSVGQGNARARTAAYTRTAIESGLLFSWEALAICMVMWVSLLYHFRHLQATIHSICMRNSMYKRCLIGM